MFRVLSTKVRIKYLLIGCLLRLNYCLMCQTESNPENSYPQKSRGNKLLFSYENGNCILFCP